MNFKEEKKTFSVGGYGRHQETGDGQMNSFSAKTKDSRLTPMIYRLGRVASNSSAILENTAGQGEPNRGSV